jgi:hypothetical protein
MLTSTGFAIVRDASAELLAQTYAKPSSRNADLPVWPGGTSFRRAMPSYLAVLHNLLVLVKY